MNNELNEIISKAIESGITLNEAIKLWSVNGIQFIKLLETASLIRDKYFGKVITYSRKVFIPLTNVCRNRCKYCGFRKDPWHEKAKLMKINEVIEIVKKAEKLKVKEVLICTGEKPDKKYPIIREKLKSMGFKNYIEYVVYTLEKIIKETENILPHVNIGVLSFDELKMIRPYVASIGLMLECYSHRLLEKGMPHEESPSKNPDVRIEFLKNCGRLKIPTTTGILIGIGETIEERIKSLFIIKKIHEEYGNIQEVIIQNFMPEPETSMQFHKPPSLLDMLKTIAIARLIYKGEISIQAPPNLMQQAYSMYILAGINDWGGISPITPDYINPLYPWPKISELKKVTEEMGCTLRERLPIYPKFIKPEYIPETLRNRIYKLIDENGLVKGEFEEYTP